MTKIQIEIKACNECPFWESKRVYTADSFEMPYDWFCKKAHNKKIAGFVEWHDEVKVPDWCPCRITTVKTDSSESLYKKMLKSSVVMLNDKVIKNRFGKTEDVTTADIRNAEVVEWDKNTKTLYLKTK